MFQGRHHRLRDKKRWNRLHSFCPDEQMHDPDPIRFIEELLDQWISRDWEDSAKGIIIGGDFSSRWNTGDHGGQRVLSAWADSRFLINRPKLITDRGDYDFSLVVVFHPFPGYITFFMQDRLIASIF